MRYFILIIAFFYYCNLTYGQYIIHVSGQIRKIDNPCLDETCLPGVVWSLETDTTYFVITKNHNWIGNNNPLIINGIEHFENDSIDIYGELLKKHDRDDEPFYELEALNKEIRNTTIHKNSSLTLEFVFPIFECGINVFRHPINQIISQLVYNPRLDSAIYTYKPKIDFVGIDTVVFLTGCGSTPDNFQVRIIEYFINVSDDTKINNFINESNFKIYPNPSNGYFNFMTNNHLGLYFNILNSKGQMIHQGQIEENLHISLRQGIYFLTIWDKNQLLNSQKIIINE